MSHVDVVVRDRLTGAPVTVLPPSPVSGYLTVSTTERLWRPDRVEVEMDARVAADGGVTKGRLLVVDDLVFLVEQVHIGSDEQSRVSALATVTGYDPATVPRLLLPASGQSHDVQTGPGESAMKHYLSANIGPDAASVRRWSLLAVAPDQERGATGSWRARYQPLVDMLELIGQETGLGYRTVWDTTPGEDEPYGRAVFDVVPGQHRDRLLSIAAGTVRGEELLSTDVDRRTYAYVAGQGEGAARTIVERHTGVAEPAELSRREEFVDARDIDATEALRSRGDAKLAETEHPDSVEVQVDEADGWAYRVDVDLGDTLRYRNAWGDDRLVRLVEVVTSWRESLMSPDRAFTLDRPFPDVSDRERVSGGTQYE